MILAIVTKIFYMNLNRNWIYCNYASAPWKKRPGDFYHKSSRFIVLVLRLHAISSVVKMKDPCYGSNIEVTLCKTVLPNDAGEMYISNMWSEKFQKATSNNTYCVMFATSSAPRMCHDTYNF